MKRVIKVLVIREECIKAQFHSFFNNLSVELWKCVRRVVVPSGSNKEGCMNANQDDFAVALARA